jgi:hypothetical protein
LGRHRLHLKYAAAELHAITGTQKALGNLLAVDKHAVRAARVLDLANAAAGNQQRVRP